MGGMLSIVSALGAVDHDNFALKGDSGRSGDRCVHVYSNVCIVYCKTSRKRRMKIVFVVRRALVAPTLNGTSLDAAEVDDSYKANLQDEPVIFKTRAVNYKNERTCSLLVCKSFHCHVLISVMACLGQVATCELFALVPHP